MFEKVPMQEKSWRGMLKRTAVKLKELPFLYNVCRSVFKLFRKIIKIVLGKNHRVKYKISKKLRLQQQSTVFDRNIKFSILVPLYNTPEKYLADMIQSVQNQTYAGWQLCLADGSDSEHSYVGEYIKSIGDSRIRYKKLQKNLGISENTNACI